MDTGEFDEVWLCPCNRHMFNKPDLKTVDPRHRVAMCELIVHSYDMTAKVFPYEIEHNLRGSWHEFLTALQEDPVYSEYDFSTVIGQDNANVFDRWVNADRLKRDHRFVVIGRQGVEPEGDWYLRPPHICVSAELPDCSSTEVRNLLPKVWKNNLWPNLPHHLFEIMPGDVLKYIRRYSLYKDKR